MLIQHIDESREGGLAGTTVEEVSDLQTLYRNSKKRFDEDGDFKQRAREAVKQLQGGNQLYVQASKVKTMFDIAFAFLCNKIITP